MSPESPQNPPAGTVPFDPRAKLLRFLFKDELTEAQALEVTHLAELLVYERGTVVLVEGDINTKLFFLVEGAVRILRGGEEVARLNEPGQILGEISLITQGTCSASSVVETRATFIMIDLERISTISPTLQAHFKNALNRYFSLILAEKLMSTNEKARLFEITNRELQRAKIALEAASADRIGELTRDQRAILKSLDTVLGDELRNLKSELDELEEANPTIGALARKVGRLVSELDPFTEKFRKEHSLHGKRVLLAEDDLGEQINARMSLGGTGVELTVVSDLEAGRAALASTHYDVICVNPSFAELIPFARMHQTGAKFVFMTSQQISEHFKTLRDHEELSTIVARHPTDRLFTVKNTATTIGKLLSGDIFGANKYLNWGVELQERRVTHNAQRAELIDEMTQYFDSMGIGSTLRRKYQVVAEELLMNAIYDAPVDQNGRALYNHLDRTVPITLSPNEQSILRYGCDGALLAISVEDPFGALQRSTIIEYLARCFSAGAPEPGQHAENKGGGGNGLFQLILSSSLVVFNVKPRVRTEVIALLNVNVQTQKVSLFPSFHFFESNTVLSGTFGCIQGYACR